MPGSENEVEIGPGAASGEYTGPENETALSGGASARVNPTVISGSKALSNSVIPVSKIHIRSSRIVAKGWVFYLDGKEVAQSKAGRTESLPVASGDHELRAVFTNILRIELKAAPFMVTVTDSDVYVDFTMKMSVKGQKAVFRLAPSTSR